MFIQNQSRTALININRCDGFYVAAPGDELDACIFTPDDHKDKYRLFADQQGEHKVLGYFDKEQHAKRMLYFITACVVEGSGKTISVPGHDEAGTAGVPSSFLEALMKKASGCNENCDNCKEEGNGEGLEAFLEKPFKGVL